METINAVSCAADLTPDDLKPLGWIRFPTPPSLQFTRVAMTGRRVLEEIRLFTLGNKVDNYPLLEWIVPEEEPNFSLNDSPFLKMKRTWGNIAVGRTPTSSKGKGLLGGLHWDDYEELLWWSYGSGYAPTNHHPTIGCTRLSFEDWESFGPYRTGWNCQKTRGAWTRIPEAFRATVNGKRAGIMAPQTSGNAGSPFGASFAALELPDPELTEPDVIGSSHYSVPCHGVLLHDIDHRQKRDTNFKQCGWNVLYDPRQGSWTKDGIGVFGGASQGSAESDTMNSMVWVDLEDKAGLIYFGQLATTREGYTAPGPDGLVHIWYGDPAHATKNTDPPPSSVQQGFKNGHCCHGQDDPWWGATGPGTHARVAHSWIYNVSGLTQTATKEIPWYSLDAAHVWQWKTKVPQMRTRYRQTPFGGAWFDKNTRRIYVYVQMTDIVTIPDRSRPAILVLEVK